MLLFYFEGSWGILVFWTSRTCRTGLMWGCFKSKVGQVGQVCLVRPVRPVRNSHEQGRKLQKTWLFRFLISILSLSLFHSLLCLFLFFALPISILFFSPATFFAFLKQNSPIKKATQQNDGRNKSGISVNKFLNIFLKNNWIIVQIVLKLNQCCLLLFLKQPLLSGKIGSFEWQNRLFCSLKQ